VLGDERALSNRAFVESIDLHRLSFDPAEMSARWAECEGSGELYQWSFDPSVLRRFQAAPAEAGPHVPPTEEAAAIFTQDGV
jgi:hypothetical protein